MYLTAHLKRNISYKNSNRFVMVRKYKQKLHCQVSVDNNVQYFHIHKFDILCPS